MLAIDIQRSNEYAYCKQHHDKYIMRAIEESPAIQHKVNQGYELLFAWVYGEYYETKQARVDQLKELDLKELIKNIYSQIAYYRRPTTFVSTVVQITKHIGLNDRKDAIKTVAEILAVVCGADAYDITKVSKYASLMIQSNLVLPNELNEAIDRGLYPLPMVVEPRNIAKNSQSPYLTFNQHQILGRQNKHGGDIALDVINCQNQIPLSLNVAFLSTVEEQAKGELDTTEKQQLWLEFKTQSYDAYRTLITQGNKFYLTYRPDKRGRLYSQGYHISTQGTAFKKAIVEFNETEVIEGVPTNYKVK